MQISKDQINSFNLTRLEKHQQNWNFLQTGLSSKGIDISYILKKLRDFQIAIPSWALGTGGTRFGRFSIGGEPRNLEEKIDDVGILHSITQSSGAISLHIPWDIPKDIEAIKQRADLTGISFDAVNSNTFQDQNKEKYSYKFGSLCHTDKGVRTQAINHNIEVINYGNALGSKSLTVWLADGTSFPGQHNFRKAFQHTLNSLKEIYQHLPLDWQLFIEYKPFEPHFYSMVIPDWGTSLMLAEECGKNAFTLVDLGHHLPNTNIEQIVSTLLMKGKLGGFHFNDSKYSDDDLTCGSINPFQMFLIFNELIYGMENNEAENPPIAWMIDASHNLKDPLEDLIQSLEAIKIAFARALIVDRDSLQQAQSVNDVALCQEILQTAFRTDVRPLVTEARILSGGALDPLDFYRKNAIRNQLIRERGKNTVATGL